MPYESRGDHGSHPQNKEPFRPDSDKGIKVKGMVFPGGQSLELDELREQHGLRVA